MKRYLFLFFASFLFALPSYLKAQPGQPFNLSYNGVFDTLFDRFGNKHALSDLIVRDNNGEVYRGPGSQNPSVNAVTCTSGYFRLFFENGCGAEGNSAVEIERRNTICQVYSDLSNFINSSLLSNSEYVNVWVRNPNNVFSTGIPPGLLGAATPFYTIPIGTPVTAGALIKSEVEKSIQSGHDSYATVTNPLNLPPGFPWGNGFNFYHALITFNFQQAYFADPMNQNATGGIPSGAQYDLYSVALHEALHTMGFLSLISANGTGRFGVPYDKYYAFYDRYLTDQSNNPLLGLSACGIYNPAYVASTTAIQPNPGNPSPNNTNCVAAAKFNLGGGNYREVYTPNQYEPGSSLSHFEDQCLIPSQNDLFFVMSNANGTGSAYVKRYPKPDERTALCRIGYSCNSSYTSPAVNGNYNYSPSTCNALAVVGLNDGINTAGVVTNIIGTNSSIAISNALANDVPSSGLSITCPQVLYGKGSIASFNATTINYNSFGNMGIDVIRYLPFDAANNVYGNPAYIFVFINDSAACGDCHLVGNGDFENGSNCGPLNIVNPNNGNAAFINCWFNLMATPDYFVNGCSTVYPPAYTFNFGNNMFGNTPPISPHAGTTFTNNKGIIGLYGVTKNTNVIHNEATISLFNGQLQPGNTYKLSYWAVSGNSVTTSTNTLVNPILTVQASQNFLAGGLGAYPISSVAGNTIHTISTNTITTTNGNWSYYTTTFTLPSNIPVCNAVCVGLNLTPYLVSNTNSKTYLYLDDFQLEDIGVLPTFNFPQSTLCLNNFIQDLEQHTNAQPPGGVFSGPGVIVNPGNPTTYSYDPNLVSPVNQNVYVTYSYTATNGCDYSTVDTVNINVPSVTITGGGQTICYGQAATLTANPQTGGTFVWQPGNIQGPSIQVTPSQTTTYTLTYTNSFGCFAVATAQVNVNVCNCNSFATTPITNTTLSGSYANSVFSMSGTYTVSAVTTLLNSTFYMAPNTKIIVPPGVTFNIDKSHLLSCYAMWDSIYVNPTAAIIVRNGSFIEDAHTAISADYGTNAATTKVDVTKTLFNRNKTAIRVRNFDNPYTVVTNPNFNIRDVVVTSRLLCSAGNVPIGCSQNFTWPATNANAALNNYLLSGTINANYSVQGFATANLKVPLTSQRGEYGIVLEKMGYTRTDAVGGHADVFSELSIGYQTSAANTNKTEIVIFDNLRYGVYAYQSNFRVHNSAFQNLWVSSKGNVGGTGVYAFSGVDFFKVARIESYTNLSLPFNARFLRCPKGIDIKDYFRVYVKDNEVSTDQSLINYIPPGNNQLLPTTGFNFSLRYSDSLRVINNRLRNVQNGIVFIADYFQIVNTIPNQKIGYVGLNNNNIQGGNSANEYVSNAIICDNIFNAQMTNISNIKLVNIKNNTIGKVFRGIRMNNWMQNDAYAETNLIELKQEGNSPLFGSTTQYGISSSNCIYNYVRYNTVKGFGFNVTNHKPNFVYGIQIAFNGNPTVTCNKCETIGKGFEFTGIQFGTVWMGNDMTDCYRGLVLHDAQIFTQGSATQASDNRWLGTNWNIAFNNQTYVETNNPALAASASPLYVRSGSQYTPVFNGALGVGLDYTIQSASALLAASGLVYDCSGGGPCGTCRTTLSTVESSLISPSTNPEQKHLTEEKIHRLAKSQNQMLSQSPLLQQFENQALYSNYEKRMQAENNAAQLNLAQAQNINAAIVSMDSVDFFQQLFFEKYLLSKTSILSAQDSLVLMNMANSCALQHGNAVFTSRAFMSAHYGIHAFEDNCPDLSQNNNARLVNSLSLVEENASFKLFPNPGQGEYHLSHRKFEQEGITLFVHNSLGEGVYQQDIESNAEQTIFKLSAKPGMYILSLRNAKGEMLFKQNFVQQ